MDEVDILGVLVNPASELAMARARDEVEAGIETALAAAVERFLAAVIDDAMAALDAPVLVAAGRVPDPFSYTQVMSRWYAALGELTANKRITQAQMRDVLEGATLPSDAFEDVRDGLRLARREGWTKYQTKRHLSSILIPKMSSGQWDDRARYRAAVRGIARRSATEAFNRASLTAMEDAGVARKRWVSREDSRVRPTHYIANGQIVPIHERFRVGAYSLMFPGDPTAPPAETYNCRCVPVAVVPRAPRTEGALLMGKLTASGRGKRRLVLATAPASGPEADAVAEEVADDGPPVGAAAEDRPLVVWSGPIGMENTMTGDGRMIEAGALQWDELPIPLRWAPSDVGGHDGAEVVGSIQYIERDGDRIVGTGIIDQGSEVGQEAARQLGEHLTNGVSMDLDDVSFEVRVAAEIVEEMEKPIELDGDDDGSEEAATARAVVDGKVVMMQINSDDEVHVTKSARIRAATIVAIPAFAEARIELVEDDEGAEVTDDDAIAEIAEEEDGEEAAAGSTEDFNWVDDVGGLPKYIRDIADSLMKRGMLESRAIATAVNTVKRWARGGTVRKNGGPRVSAKTVAKAAAAVAEWEAKKIRAKVSAGQTLTASGAPLAPPAAWFRSPGLTGPTAITVDKDGRVYGHLATWDVCHTAIEDRCQTAPRSASGYAYFHTGELTTAEGTDLAVGHLTMDTGHAGDKLGPIGALAHYDNTGYVAADVRAGEDEHGVWVAGALRPHIEPEQVRSFRSAPLSGDWRRVNGSLELVACLAVNMPGFPVPRPQGLVASGAVQSLVAAGMVVPRTIPAAPSAEFTDDDLAYLRRLAAADRADRATTLARRVKITRVQRHARTLTPKEK